MEASRRLERTLAARCILCAMRTANAEDMDGSRFTLRPRAAMGSQGYGAQTGLAGQHVFASFGTSVDQLVVKGYVYKNSTLRPEQFALTGPGYIVAERCAIEKGCPRNIIVTNDVNVPWHAPRIVPPPIPEPAGLANTSSGAPLESDRYSMLFSSAAAPSSSLPDDVLPPVVAPVKPLAKKYATGQFASVYKPAQTTVTAPAADRMCAEF